MGRRWWVLAGILLVAVAVAVLLAVAPRSQATSPGEIVAAYDAALRDGDPVYARAADLGFDPASMRFIGETDGRSFWVGRDDHAQACFVVLIEETELGGGSCASIAILQESGLTLAVDGFGDSIVVHLVPDDVDIEAAPAAWTVIGDNILVAEAEDLAGSQTLTLPRDGGAGFVVRN